MSGAPTWLAVIRRYLLFVVTANLVWEFAHLPLYTLWATATPGELAFAALHCTAGDALIATASLVGALLAVGNEDWPHTHETFLRVAIVAVLAGAGYTVFSEWLNVSVRRTWAYSAYMPVLPWLGTGLSPLAQWLVIPTLGFAWSRRLA